MLQAFEHGYKYSSFVLASNVHCLCFLHFYICIVQRKRNKILVIIIIAMPAVSKKISELTLGTVLHVCGGLLITCHMSIRTGDSYGLMSKSSQCLELLFWCHYHHHRHFVVIIMIIFLSSSSLLL